MMKLALAALLAASALAFAPAPARAVQLPTDQDAASLRDPSPMPSLDFLSCLPFRVEASTVPSLVATGPGVVYELDATSGTATSAYAIAYDSGSLNCSGGAALTAGCVTASLGVNAVANIPAGYAITPRVFTDAIGSAPTVSGAGRFVPPKGKRFVNGLVVANSDAGLDASGCYRLDSWNQVSPPTK